MFRKDALPQIIEEKNRIVIPDVSVLTDFSKGGATRYCGAIVKACLRYDESVYLEFSENETYSCKKPMAFMIAMDRALSDRLKFNIVVKPKTAVSKDLGLLVYSSFTEEDWRMAGHNRFEHTR